MIVVVVKEVEGDIIGLGGYRESDGVQLEYNKKSLLDDQPYPIRPEIFTWWGFHQI